MFKISSLNFNGPTCTIFNIRTTRVSGVRRAQHVSCNEMRTRACASVSKLLFIVNDLRLHARSKDRFDKYFIGCFSVNPLIFRPVTFAESTVIINRAIDLSRICIQVKYCFDHFDSDAHEQTLHYLQFSKLTKRSQHFYIRSR